MTPEQKVKYKITRVLKELPEVWYFFPNAGLYGKKGVPDIIICMRGYFFAIECKAENKDATELQYNILQKINHAQGVAWVANEENVDAVIQELREEYENNQGN